MIETAWRVLTPRMLNVGTPAPEQTAELLRRFPKTRPSLPEQHQQRYVADYRSNRQGQQGVARLVAGLEAWMHRAIADVSGDTVLELGAGTLNHLPFERKARRYDVVEPFKELWADSANLASVSGVYADVRDVPSDARYDKILSIAVLEHLTELPDVIARSARLLTHDGTFAAGFPSEGGLAWYLAWRFGTGTAYRLRTGLSYAPLMRHEHVNNAFEIDSVVRAFFKTVERKRFPLPLFHTSLYTVLTARDPDLRACDSWLTNRTLPC